MPNFQVKHTLKFSIEINAFKRLQRYNNTFKKHPYLLIKIDTVPLHIGAVKKGYDIKVFQKKIERNIKIYSKEEQDKFIDKAIRN